MARERFQVGVTFTIEEMYDIEADTYAEAEAKAVEEFEQDFSNVPMWAGDAPQATIYDSEVIDDE